LHPKG